MLQYVCRGGKFLKSRHLRQSPASTLDVKPQCCLCLHGGGSDGDRLRDTVYAWRGVEGGGSEWELKGICP